MTSSDQILRNYAQAYHKLYKRYPRELHRIDNDWVLVNGARISAADLNLMTQKLLDEYAQSSSARRSIAARLIAWFKADE
jgi:hypothetical protein